MFHVVLLSKITVNNSQKSVPANCIKKSVQKNVLILWRKFEVSKFSDLTIFRAVNILDRIKPSVVLPVWLATSLQSMSENRTSGFRCFQKLSGSQTVWLSDVI